jgi:hypothetical protein
MLGARVDSGRPKCGIGLDSRLRSGTQSCLSSVAERFCDALLGIDPGSFSVL